MYSRLPSRTRIGFVACSALVLTACGGGGSSSPSNAGTNSAGGNPAPAATPTTITGVAGKGLLSGATVTFYSVTSSGQKGSSLGSGTTDSKGNFSVPITATGPVIADVTIGSDTQMQDEISGQFVAAPQGLELHAVFDSPGNLNSQPLGISPLTEMAYQAASSQSGGLTTTNIDSANNAVGQVFLGGAPILSTLPIDITTYETASTAQQSLSQVLAALSVAASNGTATNASGAACTDGYPADITCMIGGLGSLINISASGGPTATGAAGYVSAALSQIDADAVQIAGGSPSAIGIDQPTASTASLVTDIQSSASVPGYQFSTDPVTNTKDVFANIRTNIVDAQSSTAYGINSTIAAIGSDLSNNVGPVAASVATIVEDAYAATSLLQSGAAAGWKGGCTNDPNNTGTATSTVLCEFASIGASSNLQSNSDGSYSFSSGGGVQVQVTQNTNGTYSVVTQPLKSQTVTVSSSGQASQAFNGVTGYSVPDASYTALSATFSLTNNSTGISGTFAGPYYVNAAGGQVTANITGGETNTPSSNLTGDITLSGTLTNGSGGGISVTNATIASDTDIHVVNGAAIEANPLKVSVQTVESSCKAGNASYCNYMQFDDNWYDPTTGALVAQGTYVCAQTCEPGYIDPTTGNAVAGSPSAGAVTGLTAFQDGASNVLWVDQPSVFAMTGGLVAAGPTVSVSGKIDISRFTTSQFSYAASVVLGTPVDDKSGTLGIPGEITFSATVGQVSGSTTTTTTPLFSGVVNVTPNVSNYDATQPVSSSSNYVSADVDVLGTLDLSNNRTLNVSLSADATLIDATKAGNNSGSFSASYSYQTPTGTFALNASGSYDPTNGATGTVTSNTGVVVALKYPVGGTLTGTVTATGQTSPTAIISNTTIQYSDGSSESLF